MARPTKEEAREIHRLIARLYAEDEAFPTADYQVLANFMARVTAALPSAAAVQADEERREAPRGDGKPD